MSASSPRRVWITGIGLISPLGLDTPSTWDALVAGRSGVGPITKFDTTGYSTTIAAEVSGFDPLRWIEKKEVRKMDTFSHYAIAATDGHVGIVTPEGAVETIGERLCAQSGRSAGIAGLIKAVLCLHQTPRIGKGSPDARSRHAPAAARHSASSSASLSLSHRRVATRTWSLEADSSAARR